MTVGRIVSALCLWFGAVNLAIAQTSPFLMNTVPLQAPCVVMYGQAGGEFLKLCSDPPSVWVRPGSDIQGDARQFFDLLRTRYGFELQGQAR